jgi:hypothetical protein
MKPYKIVGRVSEPDQISFFVEIPVGTSYSQMESWTKEIEASEGGGLPVTVNFRDPTCEIEKYDCYSLGRQAFENS